jgi:hypothetical protein
MFPKPVILEGSFKHEDSSVCMMHLCLHSAQLDVILEHKVVPVDVLVHQC